MPTAPRCFALVPCAGVGLRAGTGGPKQYARLAGHSVVAHTLRALAAVARLQATLVVLAPDDTAFARHAPAYGGASQWWAHCGGATRADTVAAGLQALQARGAAADDWVLVHDAARCLLRPAWVERLIDACEHDAVGGLLALPLADTLKAAQASPEGERSAATLERAGKWLAQTPQMFRLGLLQHALRQAREGGLAVTDEASAVEALGLAPRLVAGDQENLKLTWPADFALAARLLETR
jgi:2-C-methyl-D-erythritol 4-phosphate cytidylyltransferase/2-C-methyl-D-erythritol 4-phosphate cytidylyltransferase/2-C-methyl-D-erythritol 2,4-cyclodiphosphate synthase